MTTSFNSVSVVSGMLDTSWENWYSLYSSLMALFSLSISGIHGGCWCVLLSSTSSFDTTSEECQSWKNVHEASIKPMLQHRTALLKLQTHPVPRCQLLVVKKLLNSLTQSLISAPEIRGTSEPPSIIMKTEREPKTNQIPAVILALEEQHWDSEKKVTGKEQTHHGAGGILMEWMYDMHRDSIIYIMKCQALSSLLCDSDGFRPTYCRPGLEVYSWALIPPET